MSKSPLDLANKLEKIVDKIDKEASDIAVKVALTILGDLVRITPVDTSKALSNWQVSLTSPAQDELKAYYLGDGGSTQGASGEAALNSAIQILKSKKPGEIIYLSNVLPYIKRLNEGYSKQAPSGFVERSVLIGRKEIKKARIKL